jgi:phosphatidylserine/phosphatidylglycerophosphate/cardiolipin synthase-like enzyme
MYTFYTDTEYRHRLIAAIRETKPGERVLLMSMSFEPTEPAIAAIIHEIELAASRGVRVTLSIDAHAFLFNPAHMPGPLTARRSLPKRLSKYYQNKLQIIQKINSFPTGHAEIINIPSKQIAIPIAGRSHIKIAIVNDAVFLGGCNLQLGNSVDMMVGWHDKQISDRLYKLCRTIIQEMHVGRGMSWVDRSFDLQDNSSIFVDSGLRGQSVIFDQALALIDSAEKWLVITCQFFPNSITARHLTMAAKRGVKVEVVYSHPKHHGLIAGLGQQISILRERTRVPKSLFQHALSRKDPMLHAKLIACDKGVMIGSHNYVQAGVLLGTAEIALLCRNEKLARNAVKSLHRGLGRTTV